ncbi:MAG: molybdopterin adenylyltransferase [Anaerolineae bacterium]
MLRVAILTVSDRAASGVSLDASGPAIARLLQEQLGTAVQEQQVTPDEQPLIEAALRGWADRGDVDVILTTGGTGFARRDVTPEATQAVIDRPAPGLAEAMRAASLQVTPHAMLSRATAGIRGRTLIVNLPGSPKAACETLAVILPVLPHAAELLQQGAQPVIYHHARPGEHGTAG